jgi:hypothetical protein
MNSRYVKMPAEWPAIGLSAGLLEDLIVVLRTPSQVGLGAKHLHSLPELVDGFRRFLLNERRDDKAYPRFLFLTGLVDRRFHAPLSMSVDEAELVGGSAYPHLELVGRAIDAAISQQGNSRRVGVHVENGARFYYAIQGILGDVEFDDRVTRTLTPDDCPRYAVHFTKQWLAESIWRKEPTKTNKLTSRTDIPVGTICRFERPVHALTNVALDGGKYRIFEVDKDIRTRMTHGIKVTRERPKYQAGLVIDVPMLVAKLPAGAVKQNEIGTLLVNGDVPHECLLYCISSPEDVEAFWDGAKK